MTTTRRLALAWALAIAMLAACTSDSVERDGTASEPAPTATVSGAEPATVVDGTISAPASGPEAAVTIEAIIPQDRVVTVQIADASSPSGKSALEAVLEPQFGLKLPADGLPLTQGFITDPGSDYVLCHSTEVEQPRH